MEIVAFMLSFMCPYYGGEFVFFKERPGEFFSKEYRTSSDCIGSIGSVLEGFDIDRISPKKVTKDPGSRRFLKTIYLIEI